MFEWNKIRGSRRRMLKIAICDDEQPIREYLKRLVEKCTEGEIRLFVDGDPVRYFPEPGAECGGTGRYGDGQKDPGKVGCTDYLRDGLT